MYIVNGVVHLGSNMFEEMFNHFTDDLAECEWKALNRTLLLWNCSREYTHYVLIIDHKYHNIIKNVRSIAHQHHYKK